MGMQDRGEVWSDGGFGLICKKTERQVWMSPLIVYSLIFIFFICFTGFLLWGTYSRPQQLVASTIAPSLRESLTAYILLAGLFLFFIVLTAFTQKMGKQNNTFR